jgi:hypothetical protein
MADAEAAVDLVDGQKLSKNAQKRLARADKKSKEKEEKRTAAAAEVRPRELSHEHNLC